MTRTYSEAEDVLNGRESRKVGNNTYLKRLDAQSIGLLLHNTYVVKYSKGGSVQLDSGGWRTLTTKDRINAWTAADITQRNHVWYMGDGSLFYDGMIIHEDGEPINPQQPAKYENANKKLKARIKKYAELAIETMRKGMDLPGGGDCWFCVLRNGEGETMGDFSENVEHLISHLDDGYVVPALVWNALKEAGYQYPEILMGYEKETMKTTGNILEDSVKRALSKYLYKRLAPQL